MDRIIMLGTGSEKISVDVIYSSRKTLSLEIKGDGKIIVRAPYGTDNRIIDKLLSDKKEWLYSHYKRLSDNNKTREPVYINGAVLPLLGRDRLRISIIVNRSVSKAKVKVQESGDELLLEVTSRTDSEKYIRDIVVAYYKEIAKQYADAKARVYASKLGVSYDKIRIKEQKTRWGSCSSKNNLNFNWKLVLMPEKIFDYVIVHELSHLKQMNHSSLFYREVASVMADYKECERWIKDNQRRYERY